jgi:hypothetical protein
MADLLPLRRSFRYGATIAEFSVSRKAEDDCRNPKLVIAPG